MPHQATLEDRAAIYDLVCAYARAADDRDYPAFARIMTDDAVLAVHHGDPSAVEATHTLRGVEQIQRAMRQLERYSHTMHVVANQHVEVRGDEARGETYCVAHHLYEKDGVTYDHALYIRYRDRFSRPAGRWLFRERRLWVGFTSDRPLDATGDPLR